MQDVQKWLLVEIDDEDLSKFIQNKITIREMFLSKKFVYVISWKPGDSFESYRKIASTMLTEKELPPENTYLEADEGEFDEYYQKIINRKNIFSFFERQKILETSFKRIKSKTMLSYCSLGEDNVPLCFDDKNIYSFTLKQGKLKVSSVKHKNSFYSSITNSSRPNYNVTNHVKYA